MSQDRQSRLEARIQGLVQGVSFRFYTQRKALSLGVTGWVRNEINGDVSTVAEGAADELAEFLDFLHQGPPHARVDHVEANWAQPQGCFQRFSIIG